MNNANSIRILALSGSLRRDSLNRKALQVAKRIAADSGAVVTEADLKDLALPIFDEDLAAEGFPASVQEFRASIESAHMLIIASPEYNGSIPGGLKNALDWATRPTNVLSGKTAAIMGVSAGPFGTVRMQPQFRLLLAALNVFVLPHPQVLIRNGAEAFNPDGSFADSRSFDQVKGLVEKTIRLTKALLD